MSDSGDNTNDVQDGMVKIRYNPENVMVLVPEGSKNVLKLTDDCKKKLETGEECRTLEFAPPHDGKVLTSYHGGISGYTKRNLIKWKWLPVIELTDRSSCDEQTCQGDILTNWSFNKYSRPFISVMIQKEDFLLTVHWGIYE